MLKSSGQWKRVKSTKRQLHCGDSRLTVTRDCNQLVSDQSNIHNAKSYEKKRKPQNSDPSEIAPAEDTEHHLRLLPDQSSEKMNSRVGPYDIVLESKSSEHLFCFVIANLGGPKRKKRRSQEVFIFQSFDASPFLEDTAFPNPATGVTVLAQILHHTFMRSTVLS